MSVRPDTKKKDQLKRKKETETEKTENKERKLDNVHYGSWEEVEVLNVDWEARLREREKREEEEQKARKERIDKAEKL